MEDLKKIRRELITEIKYDKQKINRLEEKLNRVNSEILAEENRKGFLMIKCGSCGVTSNISYDQCQGCGNKFSLGDNRRF